MDETSFLNSFALHADTYQSEHHVDVSTGNSLHYLHLVTQGTAVLVGRDQQLQAAKGDLIYVPKGYPYQAYWSGEPSANIYSVGFAHFPCSASYGMQVVTPGKQAVDVLHSLIKEKEINALSIGRIYTLLGLLLPDMTQIDTGRQSQLIETAIEYMRQHPCAQMPEVAKACCISESTLYLNFQKALHKTPNDVRQELRCETAATLLATTDLSVEEISHTLGFSSSTYFRKVFRAGTGHSPSQYRSKKGTA